MAKNNNLKDFLTGVAEAIRTKKGTTDLINPQDFDSEISSISTGKPEQEKTVNLNMTEGNQVIEPEVGNVLSKVTVNKPDTLIPNNIKEGVSIGGVEGTFVGEKPEQEKSITVTENGTQEVTPDEGKVLSKVTVVTEIETGGGGNQPIMNAPTISLSGRQLTMTNPSTNGNFFSKFKVFANGTQKSEQTETTIDLYTYFNEDGTYNISAKCAGTNFQDSALSSSVSYTKFTPTTEGAVTNIGGVTPLSVGRAQFASTTVGNYALFCGGRTSVSSTGYSSVIVDAYDTELTRTTPSELSTQKSDLTSTTVGNHALFGGGFSGYNNISSVVDAYDTELTRTTISELTQARYYLAATTVGNYALFGGGSKTGGANSDVVDAYDEFLTRSNPTPLSYAQIELTATTVGNYALFGGGHDSSYKNIDVVDAYDTELTRTIPSGLSSKTGYLAATTVGNYALFVGIGFINAYDESLTRTIPEEKPQNINLRAATTVGNYALFGGGLTTTGYDSSVVEVYDETLTKTIPPELTQARSNLTATTVGNYALFAGGGSFVDTVDAYTVQ